MQTLIKPPIQSITLGSFAYTALQKHFTKAMKHETEVLADRDPEALHQMRVGLRRLRSALQAFEFAVDLPKSVTIQQIRKFAQVLGAVRDLDVLEAELEAQVEGLPNDERDALKPVFKKMKKERSRAFKQLKKTMKSKQYREFKKALEDWLTLPRYQPIAQLPIQTVLPDLLLPLVSETLLHPAWTVGMESASNGNRLNAQKIPVQQVLQQHGPTLHDLRKQMKRVRYQTELFVNQYDEAYEAQIEEFKRVQEVLGQIQDSVVLHQFLDSRLKRSSAEACPKLSQALGEKVGVAFEEWRSLSTKYLNPEFRTELRQRMLRFKLT